MEDARHRANIRPAPPERGQYSQDPGFGASRVEPGPLPTQVLAMPSQPSGAGGTLLCVPTEFERSILERVAPDLFAGEAASAVEVIGFGPVAAAARTSALIAQRGPERLILLGIAGGLEGGPPVGEAAEFGAVALDGVGAGPGAGAEPGAALLLPSALGFPQWQDAEGEVHEQLALPAEGPKLLSVCAASGSRAEAALREQREVEAAAEVEKAKEAQAAKERAYQAELEAQKAAATPMRTSTPKLEASFLACIG